MIIGFIGKKESGKTTASSALCGYANINFKDALVKEMRENFPDLLKEIMYTYAFIGKDYTVDSLFVKKPSLMRRLIQNYGTDVRRKEDKNYWVDRWIRDVHPGDNVVVDDVRFLNEADAVKSVGGILIRINRETGNVDSHISEMEMDKIKPDYEIDNNGTIDDLKEKVLRLIKEVTD